MIVHAFTDGRDTLPHAGAGFLAELDATDGRARGLGRSGATGRWTATGAGSARSAPTTCSSTVAPPYTRRQRRGGGARAAYERGETDEFIEPTLVGAEARDQAGRQRDRFNFRPDRMRQLTRALAEPGFGEGESRSSGWTGAASAGRSRATRR